MFTGPPDMACRPRRALCLTGTSNAVHGEAAGILASCSGLVLPCAPPARPGLPRRSDSRRGVPTRSRDDPSQAAGTALQRAVVAPAAHVSPGTRRDGRCGAPGRRHGRGRCRGLGGRRPNVRGRRDLPAVLDARVRDRLGDVAPARWRPWSDRVPKVAGPVQNVSCANSPRPWTTARPGSASSPPSTSSPGPSTPSAFGLQPR